MRKVTRKCKEEVLSISDYSSIEQLKDKIREQLQERTSKLRILRSSRHIGYDFIEYSPNTGAECGGDAIV